MPGAGLCLNRCHGDLGALYQTDLRFLSGKTIYIDRAQGIAH
jgi:hypothetical protein